LRESECYASVSASTAAPGQSALAWRFVDFLAGDFLREPLLAADFFVDRFVADFFVDFLAADCFVAVRDGDFLDDAFFDDAFLDDAFLDDAFLDDFVARFFVADFAALFLPGDFDVVFELGGTLSPSRRASDSAIAMACLRLVTFLCDPPLRSFPALRSSITFLTFACVFFPYFATKSSSST
jgi:hypothetical protein